LGGWTKGLASSRGRGRRRDLVVDVEDAQDFAFLVSLDDVELSTLGEAVLEEVTDAGY
jgi:hypothetical protein